MKHVVFSTLALSILGSAPAARAQSIDGRFRLSIDSTLFSAQSGTLSTRDGQARTTTSFTTIGPASAGLGIGAGVGLNDFLLIGARIAYASSTRTTDLAADETVPAATTKATANTLSIYPEIDYVLAPSATFRPYAGFIVGIDSTHTKSSGVDDQSSDVGIGAALGAHWFASESFSIDPSLSLLKTFGSEEVGGTSFDRNGLIFAGTIGLSGWFGGSPKNGGPTPGNSSLDHAARTKPAAQAKADTIVDTLTVKVTAGNEGDVRMSGDPIFDPQHVSVTITVRNDTAPAVNCTDIRLRNDSATTSLDHIARQFVMADVPSLVVRGRAVVPELLRVLDEPETTIDLCGKELFVPVPEQTQLRKFVARFADRLPDVKDTKSATTEGWSSDHE